MPAWAAPPTIQAFSDLYRVLQPQLDLNYLQTPGSPVACSMGSGAALQIQIVPAQGLFQCVRNMEAPESGNAPRDVEMMTRQFFVALSEMRKALRPILLVGPVAQLRALWSVAGETSVDLLRRLGAGQLEPDRLRQGLILGYHLLQAPGALATIGEDGIADVRIEPFVRDLNKVWIEATFSDPMTAILGAGVQVVGGAGSTTPDAATERAYACGMRAKDLLDRVQALLDCGGDPV